MQDEKKLDRYHVECPLYGKAVEIERCVDIHDVVHRIRIPSILLKEILEIENFREICWNCPQHHFEKMSWNYAMIAKVPAQEIGVLDEWLKGL